MSHNVESLRNVKDNDMNNCGIVKNFRHTSYGRRHVVPSAVSSAGMYAAPEEPAFVGVYSTRCWLRAPTGLYRQEKLVYMLTCLHASFIC